MLTLKLGSHRKTWFGVESAGRGVVGGYLRKSGMRAAGDLGLAVELWNNYSISQFQQASLHYKHIARLWNGGMVARGGLSSTTSFRQLHVDEHHLTDRRS